MDRLGPLARALGAPLDSLLGAPAPPPGAKSRDARGGDVALLREARSLGIDLAELVAEARARKWRDENRDALQDTNAFVDQHGLWSDGKRLF